MKENKKLFGTNGVRGIVGSVVTPKLIMNIAMSLGSMRHGTIAVGSDTRTSGPALCSAAKAGLLACGCNVVDVGVLPTPALQYLVKYHFDGGAMITASHNPPEYNGIKIIEGDGTEMGDSEIIKLENRLFNKDFSVKEWNEVGSETQAPHMIDEYIKAVTGAFPENCGSGITVVVDPGSGPACISTPAILRNMGCKVFTINGQMDGTFPGRLPEPSPEGLKGLSEMVVATGADFGVAHDGDADRAVFVDEKGNYVEENKEFALMQRHMCRAGDGTVVTPVSTSLLAEDIAEETSCTVRYTPVGSIYVARTMLKLKEEGKNVLFGGEGNGGLIFPGHQHCRDGGMTAAAMTALLAAEGCTLSELTGRLPSHHMIKEKIHTEHAGELIGLVKEHFSEDQPDLTDGIRINRNNMWALLRPSGTEPFMRLYVEGKNKDDADSLYSEIMQVIRV